MNPVSDIELLCKRLIADIKKGPKAKTNKRAKMGRQQNKKRHKAKNGKNTQITKKQHNNNKRQIKATKKKTSKVDQSQEQSR